MAKEKVIVGSRGKKIFAITAASVLAAAGAGVGLGVGLSGGNNEAPVTPPSHEEKEVIWGVDTPRVSGSGAVEVTNNAEEQKTTLDFSGLALDEYVEFEINMDNMTEDDYVYNINLSYDPSQVQIDIVDGNGNVVKVIGDNTPYLFAGDREESGVTIRIRSLENGATGTVEVDVDMLQADQNPVEMFVVDNQGELDQVLALNSDYPAVVTIKEGTYNLAGADGNAVITKNISLRADNGANVTFGNINVADNASVEIAGAVIEGNIKILSSSAQVVLNNTTAASGLLTLENVTITGELEEAVDADEKAFNIPTVYVADNVQARIQVIGDVEINAPAGAAGIGIAKTGSVEIFGEGKDAEASLVVHSNGQIQDYNSKAKTPGAAAIGSIYTSTGKGSYPTGKISIHDLNGLEAYAYGLGAIGIGGSMGENSLDITNVHIVAVKGGMPGATVDEPFGNKDAEGGPAIGFAWDKATTQTLNMTNVTIDYAIGGSKTAGIGGNCWNTKIAINMTNCVVSDIIGGNSAAAIGAGRPAHGIGDDSSVYITIHNSTVNATAGYRAAAIGGGYSDNCLRADREVSGACVAPEVNIVITGNSTITAIAGQLAAAIGTGYHGSRVSGNIASTVVLLNCVAGDGSSKPTYNTPDIVGLGALDPARDGSLVIDGLAAMVDGELANADAATIQAKLDAYNTANGTNYVYDASAKYYVESGLTYNPASIVNE